MPSTIFPTSSCIKNESSPQFPASVNIVKSIRSCLRPRGAEKQKGAGGCSACPPARY
ncbi:hypothetical protein HMPREF0262_02521 [Clostridium sp. ATCC 29733]|nr:hypothetical protein HMPREF0262_02521 [Clostridium sp. ATCC 29733]